MRLMSWLAQCGADTEFFVVPGNHDVLDFGNVWREGELYPARKCLTGSRTSNNRPASRSARFPSRQTKTKRMTITAAAMMNAAGDQRGTLVSGTPQTEQPPLPHPPHR